MKEFRVFVFDEVDLKRVLLKHVFPNADVERMATLEGVSVSIVNYSSGLSGIKLTTPVPPAAEDKKP